MLNFEHIESKDRLNSAIYDIPDNEDIEMFVEFLCFALINGILSSEKNYKLTNALKVLATHKNESIRYIIAKKLSHSESLPTEIAKILARDTYNVARKILMHSVQIDTDDLLEILSKTENKKIISCIARRKEIPTALSSTLVEKNIQEIIKIILENPNSKIDLETYKKIIGKYQHNKEVMKLVNLRKDLSPDIIDEILNSVDESLKKLLIETYKFNSYSKCSFSQISILDLKEHEIFKSSEALNAKQKIDVLYLRSKLSPILILRFLCKGELFSFIYAISKITDIPILNIRSHFFVNLNHDKFKEIYDQTGLPKEFMDIVEGMLLIIGQNLANRRLTSSNFSQILSHQLESINTKLSKKQIKFLISLIQSK